MMRTGSSRCADRVSASARKKFCRAAVFSIPFLGGSSANIPVNDLFRSGCVAIGGQVRHLKVLLSTPKPFTAKRESRKIVDSFRMTAVIITSPEDGVNVASHSLRGLFFEDDLTELARESKRQPFGEVSAQAAGRPLRATSAITSQKRSSSGKVV